MTRKWKGLAAALIASAVVGAVALAADDETPLGKKMELVQAKHTVLLKSYRNAVGWKKAQKEAKEAADELVKLAKEAKPLGADAIKEAAKKEPKANQADWDGKMDAFMKEAEEFAKVAEKDSTTNVEAKKAYSKVVATCSACHDTYRPDE